MVMWMLSTGIIHWDRAEIWASDKGLFEHAVTTLPTSGYTWHLQGMSQIQNGEFTEAFESFKKPVCKLIHIIKVGSLRSEVLWRSI